MPLSLIRFAMLPCLLLFCLATLTPRATWARTDGADEILEALRIRGEIDEGELIYSSVYKNHLHDFSRKMHFELLVKGKKLRSYWDSDSVSNVTCFDCYRGQVVNINENNRKENRGIKILAPESASRSDTQYVAPDPRYLGMLTAPFHETAMFQDEWEQIFAVSSKSPQTRETVNLDGVSCLKCSFVNTSGIQHNYWFADGDFSKVVKVSCHVENESEDENGSVITVVNQRVDHPDFKWFPKEVRCFQYGGGEVSYSEVLTVEKIDFSPVSEESFTIGGLRNIEVGQTVVWKTELPRPCSTGPLYWDGRDVVCKGEFEIAGKSSLGRTASMWIGGIFALAATVYFVRGSSS